MRVVLQKVLWAKVEVGGEMLGEIGPGLCLLVGVSREDTLEDVRFMANKIPNLRVFSDDEGKLNLSLMDVKGSILAVSQFTLFGDCSKGRRPSFLGAAPPDMANRLFEEFLDELRRSEIDVQTGRFQTHMKVSLCNDGPVTLIIDSKEVLNK
ncbi:D-tyrosyl-tRNA(Tyr) deacylase [Acetomicrobium thermoterrenum DSM 13490]|uniref:D-aminoacyl-tRNA deacylase n=1 Tax=Acetomicrobium thermoterrenum DSM 13490 TaxID=1120987 RepID=A0A1H3DEX5_9BACT|nr:D-aminoacyl-tRNA deacylase [Acetomicrobium thermoterrenum]SDX64244.1 D-tyrosyl-tRNA(Tyr) deacylase [Acetomicrobium thermoterrenum DSM 13490]